MKKKRSKYLQKPSLCVDPDSIFFSKEAFLRMCEGKKAYDTDWQAKFAADECFQFRGARLSWYKCEFCGLWHLTSSN